MAITLARQQSSSGTSEEWATANPVLLAGERGNDETLNKYKIGDGISHWLDLKWASVTPEEFEARLAGKANVDAGGNPVTPQGSVNRMWSPNGTQFAFTVADAGTPVFTAVTATAPVPGGGSDTGGGTTPPPADNANRVTTNFTGTPTRPLAGTNIPRDVNKLVRYTRTSSQTATTTNQYGIEVTVDSTTGVVSAVNDRNSSSSTFGTPIPAGSYVLSGHGVGNVVSGDEANLAGATVGSPYAGQWLLTNAAVGRTVTLDVDTSTGGVPPPTPPTPPTPPAGGGALPPRVVEIWHHAWSGPQPWTGYTSGARAVVNHITLGLAQSAGAGTGKLGYYNRFGSGLATSIATAKAAGVNVLMGFGGSSDGGITITNNTQADQAYDSIKQFVDDFGITGINVDLEPSGSSWTQDPLVRLITRLKTTYGDDFIVGLTPGLYGEFTAKWMSLARVLGPLFDYMAPMLYDFPEANNLSVYPDVCKNKCDIMSQQGGIPASKMILGFMMKPPAETYPNASSTTSIPIAAWNRCRTAYPGLRGFFTWEDKIMTARSWDLVTALGPTVLAS